MEETIATGLFSFCTKPATIVSMRIQLPIALISLLICPLPVALGQGQSPSPAPAPAPAEQKNVPLPPAKHGQPAFSFSGGKRVSVQKTTADGMHDYSSGAAGYGGTGVVEVGSGKNATGIVEVGADQSKTGIIEVGPGKTGKSTGVIENSPIHDGAANAGGSTDLGGTGGSAKVHALLPKSTKKPATTVVQTLGPDGKMEYKEVPFVGELKSNKRAPNITDVKDGEGKVKEYDWVKKNH